ncbi:MAG: Uma2 family endonuclease [Candidatus Poribacteria bacterium]|nr:Uma2 family endonuclease [Candidatus Poribacteria bacterium]
MKQLETHDPLQDIPLPEPGTMTLNEFLENDVEGYEYIKGELVQMPDASIRHSEIGMNLIRYLDSYVRENKIGSVYSLELSFKIGERVLKPDLAFVSAERLNDDQDKNKGFPIPPDLAIEVVSPSDIQSRILDKVRAYLDAGTRCVWVVEPTLKTVTVYKSETDIKTLTREDTLTGEDVVPGFSCPVELLFE